MNPRYNRRLMINRFALLLALLAMAIGMAFLFWILYVLVLRGFSGLSLAVFTQTTPPPGSEGGLANAIARSLMIVVAATVVANPIRNFAGMHPVPIRRP